MRGLNASNLTYRYMHRDMIPDGRTDARANGWTVNTMMNKNLNNDKCQDPLAGFSGSADVARKGIHPTCTLQSKICKSVLH